jgi:ribosomal protein L22
MTPDDARNDEVETEVVDETTLEETPVEPTEETTEAEVEETDAAEADATEDEVAEEAPAEVAEEPVATERPRRSRARRTAAARTEEPKAEPKRARPAANGTRPVVKAHAKYVRTSARKARLVADHVRGKSVVEARAILAHTPRAVAEDWEKLLNSAVANAEHNHELLGDDLHILSITADEGPTLKRFRPRAMGRASSIRKRTSHLSIALTTKEQ